VELLAGMAATDVVEESFGGGLERRARAFSLFFYRPPQNAKTARKLLQRSPDRLSRRRRDGAQYPHKMQRRRGNCCSGPRIASVVDDVTAHGCTAGASSIRSSLANCPECAYIA